MSAKTKVFTIFGLIFGLIGLTFITLSIVKNEMYMGKLIQNKWETVGFGDSKRYVKRKPEDWSVVENGLPAIVSKDVFDKANEILGGRDLGYHAYGPYKRGLNLFTCAYCGRLMSSGAWHEYYLCRMRGMGGDMRCNDVPLRFRIQKCSANRTETICRAYYGVPLGI